MADDEKQGTAPLMWVGNGGNGLGSQVLLTIYKKDAVSPNGLAEETFRFPMAVLDKETLIKAFELNFITGFKVERHDKEGEQLATTVSEWELVHNQGTVAPAVGHVVNLTVGKEVGLKYDQAKAPVYEGFIKYFPRAIEAVTMVSLAGANKYNEGKFPTTWDQIPNGSHRVANAGIRHLLEEAKGNITDDGEGGTGCLHLAQHAWNALARLELYLREHEQHTNR